ncbi:hypothetical protein BJ878DRAFT_538647 [Calycina marina]|uniref:Peptidase M20 dimerisation domain-containing protein n=1 Tax=Calycina marina TaxID=1763456 RepID=A0A9P7ZA78_9HELO|nr:hypothetical protein BJ878DRAFT_538647 [Calycina marina]
MSPDYRKLVQKALTSKSAAQTVANIVATQDISQRYLVQTSPAVDLISGGIKVNALPEKVTATNNHRIAVDSSVDEVRANLFDGIISGNTSDTATGKIVLSDFGEPPIEPSPVAPFDTNAYRVFTGTVKQVFGEEYIVAPSLMTGNTAVFYWDLSKNIHRFAPVRDEGKANGHTVDERIGMKEHMESVKFYVQMILNRNI